MGGGFSASALAYDHLISWRSHKQNNTHTNLGIAAARDPTNLKFYLKPHQLVLTEPNPRKALPMANSQVGGWGMEDILDIAFAYTTAMLVLAALPLHCIGHDAHLQYYSHFLTHTF